MLQVVTQSHLIVCLPLCITPPSHLFTIYRLGSVNCVSIIPVLIELLVFVGLVSPRALDLFIVNFISCAVLAAWVDGAIYSLYR